MQQYDTHKALSLSAVTLVSQWWRRLRTGAEEIYGLGELSQYEQEGLKVRSYSLICGGSWCVP